MMSRLRLHSGRGLLLTAVVIMIASRPVASAQEVTAKPKEFGGILHTSGARPSFEVVSIRPSGANGGSNWMQMQANSAVMRGVSIKDVIGYAYGVGNENEFSGGPSWIRTEKFDIEAKPGEAKVAALGKLSSNDRDEQLRLMMQSLLMERFKLKVSFPKKELSVYVLVVAKGGFKCTKIADGGSSPFPAEKSRFPVVAPPPPPPPPGATAEETRTLEMAPRLTPRRWPVWLLVSILSAQPEVGGRLVLDKTVLEGRYDCAISWVREGVDIPGPSFFTAVQEQLGLKFEPEKDVVETVMVESVERPSEN
jgi:uncharacterized protein (TIGR03435 family)